MATDLIQLELIRVSHSDLCTQGVLRVNGWAFAVTLEPPWHNNQEDISCIPVGQYLCQRIESPHFGETFEVTGVPHRTHILFHKLNLITETKGCIGVGEEFGGTYAAPMLGSSARGYLEFMKLLDGQRTFWLQIREIE